MFIRNLLHIYALLICFVSTIILIITISISFNSATDFFLPEYTYYSSLRQYNSNENYIQYNENMLGEKASQKLVILKKLSQTELTVRRENERKDFLEGKKVENITTLISTFQWTLVALLFFFIHWRLYQRSKE